MTAAFLEKRDIVAKAIAFFEGARIVGPSLSRAVREFGWKGDGEHLDKYAEAHWREYIPHADAILEALASCDARNGACVNV